MIHPFGSPGDALADDVALDFAGAGGDRVLAGGEHAAGPARGVGNELAAFVHQRVEPEHLARGIGDAQAQLGTEDSRDRALGPGADRVARVRGVALVMSAATDISLVDIPPNDGDNSTSQW